MTATELETTTIYFVNINEHSTILPNRPNDWTVLWVLVCTVHLTVCSYHVTYRFHSEFTLYSCLNVKDLFARNRRDICILSDYSAGRTHNHLVDKRTLNHSAKLAKCLSFVLSTYLYSSLDCMFLSSHEWIAFQSESTLYSCLNVKDLLSRNRARRSLTFRHL